MRTRIVSIQEVLPEHRYTQAELAQAFTDGRTAQHAGAGPLPHDHLIQLSWRPVPQSRSGDNSLDS